MLEPFAEDELSLLVRDVWLGELLPRDLEREGREVAAAEVGRDVGGGKRDVAALGLHLISIQVGAAPSYERLLESVRFLAGCCRQIRAAPPKRRPGGLKPGHRLRETVATDEVAPSATSL